MKRFCRRRFPNEYQRVAQYIDEHPDTLVQDFADVLRAIEERHSHRHFLDAARIGDFASTVHKGLMSCLLIIHAMRSHEFMTSMIEGSSASGVEKWEFFWLLKNAWSDRFVLSRAVSPLGLARWVLYRTEKHRFPLCDSPVMVNRDNVMAILSPRLLAEIDFTLGKDFGDIAIVHRHPHSGIVRLVTRRAEQQGPAAAEALARYGAELAGVPL